MGRDALYLRTIFLYEAYVLDSNRRTQSLNLKNIRDRLQIDNELIQ